jgi:hypothetical protein
VAVHCSRGITDREHGNLMRRGPSGRNVPVLPLRWRMMMFLGARDPLKTAQDMAVVVGRFVRDRWRGVARLIGGPAPDGGASTRTTVRGRPRRPQPASTAAPHRKGKARAAPDFRTRFVARRSRDEMVDGEREIYRAGTPQDVPSVRAKSQRHRKSTADRWNR